MLKAVYSPVEVTLAHPDTLLYSAEQNLQNTNGEKTKVILSRVAWRVTATPTNDVEYP